jgi:hypothetical protein
MLLMSFDPLRALEKHGKLVCRFHQIFISLPSHGALIGLHVRFEQEPIRDVAGGHLGSIVRTHGFAITKHHN